MAKIKELKEALDVGNYGDNIINYDSGCICEIFSYIADDVDCYWSELLDWLKEGSNEQYVEAAVKEGLTDTRNFDLFKALQAGQYMEREQDLYEHLEDIIKYALLAHIEQDLKIEELTEEQEQAIDEIDTSDSNSELEDLIHEVDNILQPEEEA